MILSNNYSPCLICFQRKDTKVRTAVFLEEDRRLRDVQRDACQVHGLRNRHPGTRLRVVPQRGQNVADRQNKDGSGGQPVAINYKQRGRIGRGKIHFEDIESSR